MKWSLLLVAATILAVVAWCSAKTLWHTVNTMRTTEKTVFEQAMK